MKKEIVDSFEKKPQKDTCWERYKHKLIIIQNRNYMNMNSVFIDLFYWILMHGLPVKYKRDFQYRRYKAGGELDHLDHLN